MTVVVVVVVLGTTVVDTDGAASLMPLLKASDAALSSAGAIWVLESITAPVVLTAVPAALTAAPVAEPAISAAPETAAPAAPVVAPTTPAVASKAALPASLTPLMTASLTDPLLEIAWVGDVVAGAAIAGALDEVVALMAGLDCSYEEDDSVAAGAGACAAMRALRAASRFAAAFCAARRAARFFAAPSCAMAARSDALSGAEAVPNGVVACAWACADSTRLEVRAVATKSEKSEGRMEHSIKR